MVANDRGDGHTDPPKLEIPKPPHPDSETRFRQLSDTMALAIRAGKIGIWEADMKTYQSLYNEQMHRIYDIGDTGFRSDIPPNTFGGTFEEWLAVIHPDDRQSVLDALGHAREHPAEVVEYEHRIFTPSGEIRHIRSAAQIFAGPDGELDRAVGTAIDVTESRHLTDELRQAKETAEAAERAKGEFLATMSHEIRTPMNTVLGMTRLALQTELTSKQYNYLSKIDIAARALIGIINDILDFSKIEAGKLELQQSECSIESILESTATVTGMRAEEKGLELVFDIAETVPPVVIADPLRLGQILINLVNNAVKFTDHGEIIVSVSVVRTNGSQVTLQFDVRDSGIGLTSEQIESLFQAFSQAHLDISRRYGGTGLGLSICKQLAELMGGQIWATGEPGKGSTFSFTITANLPDRASRSSALDRRASPHHLQQHRVLIVDDNDSAREILSDIVRRFGMRVETASSGAEALGMLHRASQNEETFELILMDWRMPSMDGLETARLIKNDPELQYTPAILMVTAFAREEILHQSEQLGLDGVIIKPVTDSVLFNTICDVFEQEHDQYSSPAQKWHDERAYVTSDDTPETDYSILNGRRVLVVDDNGLNREVATDFLYAVGMRVESAVDGEDALRHLKQGNYEIVLMDVHMPNMDGLDTTREIRKNPKWRNLPVIALTAQAQSGDREASLAAGMNAHITKPIDETVLYDTMIQLLATATKTETGQQAKQLAPRETHKISLPTSAPYIDVSVALTHLSGKEDRVIRFMQSFVRDFSSAQQQTMQDEQSGNYESILTIAHTIKSAAAYLGANALSTAAAQLEAAASRSETETIPSLNRIFHQRLAEVLETLRHILDPHERQKAPSTSIDQNEIITLIDRVDPLVSTGDYAAIEALSELRTMVARTSLRELAETACDQFEELELPRAKITLRKMRRAVASLPTHDTPEILS